MEVNYEKQPNVLGQLIKFKSLFLLTDGPLLLGGRGKGGFDDFLDSTAPILLISCSYKAFTRSQCTNVKCGISCDSKHDLIYCKQKCIHTTYNFILRQTEEPSAMKCPIKHRQHYQLCSAINYAHNIHYVHTHI